eukprot:579503-Ditylum_brightwellii.AAC.1
MQLSAKQVQWQNGVQNHQNRESLPALNPKINGYESTELFQWEMCLQFHSRGVSKKFPTIDVGDKIKKIIVKLQETHTKDKFSIFIKDGKIIQLEAFPKKPVEIK